MDNNKSKNPLEELKKINQRMAAPAETSKPEASNPAASKPASKPAAPAASNPSARPAPQVRANQVPVAPAVRQAQAAASAQTPRPAPIPRTAPQVNHNTNDELVKLVNKSASTPESAARAEKVRQARLNLSDSTSLDRTRVTPAVNVKPAVPAQNAPAAAVPVVPTSGTSPTVRKKAKKKEKENAKETFEDSIGRGVITNSVKAVIYIVSVLIISGCLSLFAIFVGNDVFAFVKDSNEVTVNVPAGADLDDIAKILGDNDIVKYPSMFKLYINFRKKGADEYLSGDITVSPSMPYDTLIAKFKPNTGKRTELTITIVEGMDVDEIIELFVNNGIGTKDGFVDAIQNYDFDFWFVEELDNKLAENPDSGRTYRLEGYLFPDTYNFFSNASEADVIYKLLSNFDAKFDQDKRTRAAELGYTCDEIVNLASIIQKEAKYISDYDKVSSVFHNRLNTNVTNGKLESNATVQYTMPDEDVRLELTYAEIEKYDNAYNTYLYKGLPVAPISNPSLNAINMALYPADTDYYFFVSDMNGLNVYAKTAAEHARNCDMVEQQAAAAANPASEDGE